MNVAVLLEDVYEFPLIHVKLSQLVWISTPLFELLITRSNVTKLSQPDEFCKVKKAS